MKIIGFNIVLKHDDYYIAQNPMIINFYGII